MVQQKLVKAFQKEIESGAIVENGQIPTFRDLSRRYSCSVTTVKRMVDDLARLGLLRVIRGRGTFVAGQEKEAVGPERSQLIGAIILDDQFLDTLEQCKDDFLGQGWMFSIYRSTPDAQSPERERSFLRKAQELAFSAIVIEASPIAPVNTDFFRRMRSDGMKVIHLSPYIDDMSAECAFLPDFRSAGLLAAVKAALAGYESITFFPADSRAPFSRLVDAGIRQIAGEIPLAVLENAPATRDPEAVRAFLRTVPRRTAVVCLDSEMGSCTIRCAQEEGMEIRKDFGVVSIMESPGDKSTHSFMTFDFEKITRDALNFAIDRNRSPFEAVCHCYPAHFCDLNTL